MAKALAFSIEGQTVCCRCAYDLAKISKYPCLFFNLTGKKDLVKVPEDAPCNRCGDYFGSQDALKYADRICDLIEGIA